MSKPVNSRSKLLGFPKSYAFVVGINNYPKINANLKSAVNDARALAIALKHRQGFDHVELLLDPQPEEDQAALQKGLDGIDLKLSADGATFRDMLERIQDPKQEPVINSRDCIVFYYAGHGKPGAFEEGPRGYLLPSDAQPEMAMLKNDSLIAMEAVFEALKKLDCHHTLLILDCCFAGKFRYADDSRMGRIGMSNMPLYAERFERYKREKAWQVIVSAGPNQTAADWLGERQELANGIHSPFAEALLEALEGKAELIEKGKKQGDGVLTAQELFLYLWNKVETLTKDGHLGDKSQYPDLFPMANHQGGQFIFFDPNNKLNFADRKLRNPYQGLNPFGAEVSDLFFGRTAVVKELVERIVQTDLLLVTAPSGSGKSSVVKAGLYPALLNWVNPAGEKSWEDSELLILRPGTQPWSGKTVNPYGEQAEKPDFYSGLQPLLTHLDKTKRQILLLDQYEELFTEGASEEEVTTFEARLIELYQSAKDNQLKIIITLRSDYEWLLENSAFGQAFWDKNEYGSFLYRLRAMQIHELREALVGPALAELYEFETDKLAETILAEVGYAPGALPMLSFLMSRFYEVTNKDERVFTAKVYQQLGGINGALSQYADRVYEALNDEHKSIMEKLIIRMVKISDGNYLRRRVYVSESAYFSDDRGRSFVNEFAYPGTQNESVLQVLQLLEQKQLIIAGSDRIGKYYEPVHDALLKHWKTAKQWIADFGVDNLNLQRQLWQDVIDSTGPDTPMAAGDAYGADIEDELRVDRSLTDNISKTWASNPKLLQIIGQVSYAAQPLMLREKDAIVAEALPHIAEEDHTAFQKFWDECYDEGRIPDLNSLILSGYSDKLLDIFLKRGNHWLNEAEANFIVASWEERIKSIMDMKRQRDEFKAAQQRTAEELIEASWKTGVYLPEPGSDGVSGSSYVSGSRDLYERLKLLMNLKKAGSLTLIPIFVKGPHGDDYNVNAATFGYYNPEYLAWAKKFVIPAKKSKFLRDITTPFYKGYLQDMARTYFMVYHYLEKNTALRDRVKGEYLNFVESGQVRAGGSFQENSGGLFLQQKLRAYPDQHENTIMEKLGELAFYNWVVAAGFWIRRHIDTTALAFFEILTELLETYDEEWINNPPSLPEI